MLIKELLAQKSGQPIAMHWGSLSNRRDHDITVAALCDTGSRHLG